jgi:RNA polymerase sigma-70 factor (ECF subfamily)
MSDDIHTLEMLARARAGDAAAFGQLYDAYAVRIYRFMLAQVQEPADAEDLTHQVFLKVIVSLGLYEDRGLPFGAWLFRVARNTLVDFGRRRRSSVTIDDTARNAHEDVVYGAPEGRAADRADVKAALAQLTPDQREVILLRFFAGLSSREISVLMGKREGSVRALQFRALATLRRHLGADEVWESARGEVLA